MSRLKEKIFTREAELKAQADKSKKSAKSAWAILAFSVCVSFNVGMMLGNHLGKSSAQEKYTHIVTFSIDSGYQSGTLPDPLHIIKCSFNCVFRYEGKGSLVVYPRFMGGDYGAVEPKLAPPWGLDKSPMEN